MGVSSRVRGISSSSSLWSKMKYLSFLLLTATLVLGSSSLPVANETPAEQAAAEAGEVLKTSEYIKETYDSRCYVNEKKDYVECGPRIFWKWSKDKPELEAYTLDPYTVPTLYDGHFYGV